MQLIATLNATKVVLFNATYNLYNAMVNVNKSVLLDGYGIGALMKHLHQRE